MLESVYYYLLKVVHVYKRNLIVISIIVQVHNVAFLFFRLFFLIHAFGIYFHELVS